MWPKEGSSGIRGVCNFGFHLMVSIEKYIPFLRNPCVMELCWILAANVTGLCRYQSILTMQISDLFLL